jgi:hypothetical protein
VQGFQGAVGASGTTGATGATGPQGAAGVQGSTGATGSTGPTGPTGPQGPLAATAAVVATGESRANSAYGDLTTGGPSVTVSVNSAALVIMTSRLSSNTRGICSMSFEATSSGGPNIAASDDRSLVGSDQHENYPLQASATYLVTGLSAGSYTFTAKYKSNAASVSCTFTSRNIIVIPQ